ncbi:MAG TPA: Glu-tRNA(Gln) amidotransferase subunit GatE [Thermoanaerobaculia bacterium]|nr:Glu-tRNA(Gln) amidotransferase subunit GatE [Thermoanaerobaculia bacterium]HUM30947.1 Glu-tRNA(Gln) amidotransferase subunit GatE [Thermoanaerobaculia bacterium]HXK69393.1 Glu-tRNA(Gln) amidotransferase subunit GatE [Thermoanaerobaculia bacterium]
MKTFTIHDPSFYHRLGFKCGLEVHYQLATEKKLFCNCPAVIRNDKPDATILRHMRPTLSELGEYDGTALMEFKTKKNVTYQLYRDTVCTYEMDDTPPFPINTQALEYALTVATMLGMNVVDEFHISRKQYLDGSIPTGFQRTGIIALGGALSLRSGKKIRLSHLCLEEDACREISDRGHEVIFRTDRLSFPLVEVITEPDISDPYELVETSWRISELLRATGKVRRGIGTVRQDVNVSIKGGRRIEIKGVPRIPLFPRLVHSEAIRQFNLLDIKKELRARGITADNLKTISKSLTRTLKHTRIPVLRAALDRGDDVRGICLCGFAGLLNHELQPGVPFSRDFSGRVRVIACLDEPPILFHTDDRDHLPLSEEEWKGLRETFEMKSTDVVVIVWGPEIDTKTAVEEIRIRACEACDEIPPETRQALRDGTTDFERILPGPDRMYPDTDSAPVAIPRGKVEAVRSALPPDPARQEESLIKAGLSEEFAGRFVRMAEPEYVEAALSDPGVARFLAAMCVNHFPSLRREGLDPSRIPLQTLIDLASLCTDELFPPSRIRFALQQICLNPAMGPQDFLVTLPDPEEIRNKLRESGNSRRSLDPEPRKRAIMGEVMRAYGCRVPGTILSRLYEEINHHER